jgi:lysophospholipase L1-like esterase
MNCNVDAQVGTGLVSDGRKFSSDTFRLIDRLPTDQMLYAADVVIVDAGRNDLEVPPTIYGNALEQYLRRVTEIWLGTKIVVIAPSYLSPEPYVDYDARISVISKVVKSFGGILIDPLAEGWYEAANVSILLLPDNVHPNQSGHQFIALKLEQSLLNRGIGKKGR